MNALRVAQRLQARLQGAVIGKGNEFIQCGDHETGLVVDTKPTQRRRHVICKSGHDPTMIFVE